MPSFIIVFKFYIKIIYSNNIYIYIYMENIISEKAQFFSEGYLLVKNVFSKDEMNIIKKKIECI